MKSIKKLLALGMLTGIIATAEPLPYLDINLTNLVVNQSSQVRRYSLREKTNLLDPDWIEVNNKRGTESSLVFELLKDKDTAFYKVFSNYEPIDPTNKPFHFTHGTTTGPQTFQLPIEIINYDTTNINIVANILVNDNPYNVSYTSNMPFTNCLTPGTNILNASVTLDSGYGSALWGLITLDREAIP